MKKLFIALLMLICLIGCGSSKPKEVQNFKFNKPVFGIQMVLHLIYITS